LKRNATSSGARRGKPLRKTNEAPPQTDEMYFVAPGDRG